MLLFRFDDSGHEAPVPLLFSSDPEDAAARIAANNQAMYDMLHLLVSRLLHREELSLEEAMAYVANPRKGVVERPLASKFSSKKSSDAAPSGSQPHSLDPAPSGSKTGEHSSQHNKTDKGMSTTLADG